MNNTATKNTPKTLTRARIARTEDNSARPLAEGICVTNNTRISGLNNNDLLLGSSGSGKTGSYIVPQILSAEHSFVCADTKGNLYRNYKHSLVERGFEVYKVDMNIFDQCECGYDPMSYIGKYKVNGKERWNEQDIISLAHTLSPHEKSKDAYWETSTQTVLSCIISYVLEAFDEEYHNLVTVSEVYKAIVMAAAAATKTPAQGSTKTIDFLEEWAVENPDSFAVKRYRLFQDCLNAEKTWGCLSSFVGNALSIFEFEGARKMSTMASPFRFNDLGHRKIALFVNVSDVDRTMDRIVGVFYTQLFQALIREADAQPTSRLPVPVRIMLDDFGTNFAIPDFDKVISVIRSRGIYASVILQSLCQLDSAYSTSQAQTIIGNADHILYLGGTDVPTARYVSERVCKPYDSVMCLPSDQAYLLARGSRGQRVTKIKPYSYRAQTSPTIENEPSE